MASWRSIVIGAGLVACAAPPTPDVVLVDDTDVAIADTDADTDRAPADTDLRLPCADAPSAVQITAVNDIGQPGEPLTDGVDLVLEQGIEGGWLFRLGAVGAHVPAFVELRWTATRVSVGAPLLLSGDQTEDLVWSSPDGVAPTLDTCAESAWTVSRVRHDVEVWWGGPVPEAGDGWTAWCGAPVQLTLDVRGLRCAAYDAWGTCAEAETFAVTTDSVTVVAQPDPRQAPRCPSR